MPETIDRGRFGDNLMRQNQLVLDGWKIIRFSYDDLTQRKRRCQQMILHMTRALVWRITAPHCRSYSFGKRILYG